MVHANVAKAGGGMRNGGTASIRACTVRANAASRGGGILSYGTLTLDNSTLQVNTAACGRGGIYTYGKLMLHGVRFVGNTAPTGPASLTHSASTLSYANEATGRRHAGTALRLVSHAPGYPVSAPTVIPSK